MPDGAQAAFAKDLAAILEREGVALDAETFIFVDDAESMLAILGMVQAEKEGEREGKLMKAVRCDFPFCRTIMLT